MSSKDETYNGWTNRATWHTNLVISNEYSSYQYWRERARRCIRRGKRAVDNLAGDMVREIGRAHVPDDVKSQAVNWREIASSWIEEERQEMERDA